MLRGPRQAGDGRLQCLGQGSLAYQQQEGRWGLEVQVKVVRTLTSIIIWAPKWTRSTGYQGGNRW